MGKHRKKARDAQVDFRELSRLLSVSAEGFENVRDLGPLPPESRDEHWDSLLDQYGPTTFYGTSVN